MGTLRYLISEGGRGLFQAKLVTFVSMVTIAVVLFIAGLVCVTVINVWAHLNTASERADFAVYLTDAASDDEKIRSALFDSLRSLPQVRQVVWVSKEEALKRFADLYGSAMLDAVDGNPLPASYELSLKREHLSSTSDVRERLQALHGVEGVRYAREWLEFLARFERWFFYAVAALAVVMITTLHITISNTIKLTIYARRELVRNMNLVGATRFFISMPFIVEGMLQGCIGGVLAAAMFLTVKIIFTVEPSLRQMQVGWGPSLLPLSFLFSGVLFGWIGSVFAVRKFLD
jgi:cell division transport system permease protein